MRRERRGPKEAGGGRRNEECGGMNEEGRRKEDWRRKEEGRRKEKGKRKEEGRRGEGRRSKAMRGRQEWLLKSKVSRVCS